MIKLLLFSFLLSSTVFGQVPLCERTQNDMRSHLELRSSRISLKNGGGVFGQGVCWWHARLQRSSAYLAKFAPDLPAPTEQEAYGLLHQLRNMNDVVVIPGFSDFESFTKSFAKTTQKVLNQWQKFDGLVNFEWIRGISGKNSLPPQEMKRRMQNVFAFFKESSTPLWVMAQIKGVASHSLLFLNMNETEKGYQMQVIDSNHPLETVTITYQEGDIRLHAKGEKYSFVPYVGFQNDFHRIGSTLEKYCPDKSLLIYDLQNARAGEVEFDQALSQ